MLPSALARMRAAVSPTCDARTRMPTIGLGGEFIDDLASAVIEALPKMDEQPLQEINEGRPVSLYVGVDVSGDALDEARREEGAARAARRGRKETLTSRRRDANGGPPRNGAARSPRRGAAPRRSPRGARAGGRPATPRPGRWTRPSRASRASRTTRRSS